MEKIPTIDIIFPLRNRSWVLPYFLDCIYNLDYPKEKLSIICLLNDSIDNSSKIIKQFEQKHRNEYKRIYIYTYNLNTPEYQSQDHHRGGQNLVFKNKNGISKLVIKHTEWEVYKSLAKLRNSLIHKTKSSYIFSVDTDILFKYDILNRLLKHNCDFVSSLICNGHMLSKTKPGINPYDYTNAMIKQGDGYVHIKDHDGKGLVEVDLTGAISLMSRKLINAGAEYYDIGNSAVHYGEDAGFCESAQKLGFKIFCDTDTKSTHIMSPEYLDLYLKGEFVF